MSGFCQCFLSQFGYIVMWRYNYLFVYFFWGMCSCSVCTPRCVMQNKSGVYVTGQEDTDLCYALCNVCPVTCSYLLTMYYIYLYRKRCCLLRITVPVERRTYICLCVNVLWRQALYHWVGREAGFNKCMQCQLTSQPTVCVCYHCPV